MPPARKITRVAVGVLLRGDGSVLLADRPEGKPYAGYWEFPGGKIEQGEPVDSALERELHEELGIAIGPSLPWVTFEFDYPHAYVELQFRLVCQWQGEPQAREGQRLRFVDPGAELPQPLLPAAVPALRWLLLPPTIAVEADQQTNPVEAAREDAARLVVVELGQGDDGSEVVDEARSLAGSGFGGPWQGVWADSRDDLYRAAEAGIDFVLVRDAGLAAQLRVAAGPLPAYLPATTAIGEMQPASGHCMTRRWIDLRSTTGS